MLRKGMFTDKIKKTILDAAQALTGYKKRAYIAQVSMDYFGGKARRTEQVLSLIHISSNYILVPKLRILSELRSNY